MLRSLYITDTQLLTWNQVGVFVYDSAADTTTIVPHPTPSGDGYQFYEVSVVQGQGSWWVPTSSHSSTALWEANGGSEPLVAEGTGIWTEDALGPVLRPTQLLFWLPEEVWGIGADLTNIPASNQGDIPGAWPVLEPIGDDSGGGGGSIQVHQTDAGVSVVISPGQQSAIVAISIGDPDGTQ